MSETHADLCEKCGAEIDSTRTVDLTLKNEPRICDSCFVKEPLRPTQRREGLLQLKIHDPSKRFCPNCRSVKRDFSFASARRR